MKKLKNSGRLFSFWRLSFVAVCLLPVASPVMAEEWYLPRRTTVLKQGTGEIGVRMQVVFNRDGAEFDRKASAVLSLKYAPINRLELHVEGPYIYHEYARVVFPKLVNSHDKGFGDLFAEVKWDMLSGQDWKVILTVDGSLPTGKNLIEDAKNLGSGFYWSRPG